MRHTNKLQSLISGFLLFLAALILAAGLVFFAGYLFKSADSGVVSAFGYAFHVAGENDRQDGVAAHTLIIAETISPRKLTAGNLVTVVTADGQEWTAVYRGVRADLPQQPYRFAQSGDAEERLLTEPQLRTVALHRYHSDLIGRVLYACSAHRVVLLTAEGALLLLLGVLLMVLLARRNKRRLPKPDRTPAHPTYDLSRLVTVEQDVPFESDAPDKTAAQPILLEKQ